MVSARQTKAQLLEELEMMRARVASLEEAEKKLSKREEFLFESVPTGVCISRDCVTLYANSSLGQIFGYKDSSELVGRSFLEHIVSHYRQELVDSVRSCEQGEDIPAIHEIVAVRKDDTEFPLRIRFTRIEQPEGMAILGFFTDITAQKQAEGASREDGDIAQQYLDLAGIMFVAIDNNHTVNQINKKGCEILGYTTEEIVGSDWFEIFIPQRLRKEAQTTFNRLVTGEIESAQYFENPVMTRDGVERIISWHNALLKDRAGNITGMLSAGEDITERKLAEETLRESEEKFRNVTEQSPDGIVLADEHGSVIGWNPAMEKITGLSRADTIGQLIWDIQFNIALEEHRTPEAYERAKNSYLDCCRTGQAPWSKQLLEQTFRRSHDGTLRTIQTVSFPIETNTGFLVGTIMRDITEHQETVEALQKTTEDLARFFGLALDLLCIADTDGRFIKLNIAWEKTLGYKLEEMEGKSFLELVHPDDLENTLTAINKLSRGQEMLNFVNRYRCQDGSYRWIEWNAVPHEEQLIYAAARDITERKQAEETLADERAMLRTIIDILPVIVYAKNIVCRKILTNHMDLEYMRASTEAEVLGKTDFDFYPEEIAAQFYAHDQVVIQTGQSLIGYDEPGIVTADGKQHWLLSSKVPLRNSAGQIIGLVGVGQDITERKQAEEALQKRNREITRLYEVSKELGNTLDQAEIYETVYQSISTSMDCDGMFIVLSDPTDKLLRCSYARHENSLLNVSSFSPLPLESGGRGPQDVVIRTGEPLNLPDYQAYLKSAQEYYSVTEKGFSKKAPQAPEHIRSALLVPLKLGNQVIGVLQVYSHNHHAYSPDDLQFLMTLASQVAVATANADLFADIQREIFQRAQAEEALQESERFARSTLDGLSAHIAILDSEGAILAVNHAWRDFAQTNSPANSNLFEGANYLKVCDAATGTDAELASDIAGGIRDVLAGKKAQFEMEYPCHSASEQRWFVARVTRFPGQGPARVVVAHENITRRKLAEVRLEEQLAFLQTLMDAMPNPVFYKDTSGLYLGCNAAYAAFRGLSTLHIIGRSIYEMGDPSEIAANHTEVDAALLHSTGTQVYETQSRHADGTLHDVIIHKATFTDTDGNVDGLVGIIMDITERKQMEAAEREQRALAEALADIAATINQSLNLDETFGSILASLARVMPHDGANIMRFHKESGDVHVARYCECYAKHGLPTPLATVPHQLEDFPNIADIKRHGHPLVISDVQADKSWAPIPSIEWIRSYVAAPIRIEGKVIGVINVNSRTPGFFTASHAEQLQAFADQAAVAIHNATLYSEMENYSSVLEQAIELRTNEMRQNKERVEAILSNSPDAVLLFKSNGSVDTCNLAFQKLFGYEVDELYGQQPIQLVAASHAEQLRDALDEVVSKQTHIRFESLGQHKDGKLFDVDIAIAPIKANEELRGIVCSLRDISALKEVERMKDAFVSNVSHELRTPVANIKLNHRLLLMDPEHPEAYMDRLGREIERLNVIIEDLLRLSRLDQGRMSLTLAPLDLNMLVAEYVDDRTPLAVSKQMVLLFEKQPDLPLVRADKGLVGQVLSVLLTNAFNYTPAGGCVTVRTQTGLLDNKPSAGFSVSDTGPGIPANDRPHLFERFFRGKVGRDSGAPGTGLGLAIAREIVQRHNGKIELVEQTENGKGTTFCVWLPLEEQST